MLWSLLLSLIAAAFVIQIAVFSTTIFLHRCATHRSLVLHPAVAFLFRLALWITTGVSTKEWVAVHRKHHAFTDEPGDPHSPRMLGFWKVQWGNVFYYTREARNPATIAMYAKDIHDDVWERWFFQTGWLGPTLGTAVLCVLSKWVTGSIGWGFLAAGVHAFMYIFVLSSSINGLCHWVGYRNFDNTATNLPWLALLTGGEGLHNNHHAWQRSAKFSWKKWELDPAWPVIKLFTLLGLARPYRTIEQFEAEEAAQQA